MKKSRTTRIFLMLAVCCLGLRLAKGFDASAVKSCRDIAGFIATSGAGDGTDAGRLLDSLNCAAAQNLPANAQLELTRTKWNPGLQRWEFVLRCARPQACVPFLVWAHGGNPHKEIDNSQPGQAKPPNSAENTAPRLVKTGQTALLTWDGGGIRVALLVTCLDAGSLGQTVRARLKNGNRILRAEVVGAGELTANL